MKWFEGSITEAVATSKSRKAIFVVFVEGKDDTSAQVAEAINTTEVSCRLEQDDFVAIRLESGSENYRFFAQIYQLVPVPSVFFIGTNGTPLEIIAGTTTATDLITKIELVLSKAGKNENSSMNLIDAEKKATTSSGTINSNTNVGSSVDFKNDNKTKSDTDVPLTQTTLKNENSIVTTEDVKVEPCTALKTTEASVSNSETQGASTKELSPEEKLERAKQLIELQRVQHVEEEKQKEKEREIERRKIGRDVQKMRQKQQDLEIKQAHEERLREKAADAAAREKVRQQIAQDKLERKQRESAMQQQMQKQQGQEPPKMYASMASDASVTRIQFKLPSGSPHMGQFEPTNTLRDLRNYVVQNIDLPFRQFAMSISFPRRDLTAEEDNKTLLQLELVPTAVILILPLKNPNVTAIESSTPDVGFLSRFMWSFVAPVMYVYNYMIGYFSGGTRQNTQRPQNSSPENVDTEENSSDGIIPNLRNVQTSGLVRRYLGSQGGTTIKTEGHIHRLHSGGEDNDENNTWNGNSTQQM